MTKQTIYTGYFARERQYPIELTRISIARWDPRGVSFQRIGILAPSADLLEWWKTTKQDEACEVIYTERFIEELKPVWANALRAIESIQNDVILLCYERRESFCHRHIVADLLRKESLNVQGEYPV
jgi:uncharacterized protein YeaO (DUF488 family)